jgi:toxin-antitoxin system PIN domain toxin
MKHLCDSNVFIALTLEAHPHHHRALQWLEDLPSEDILYLCRSTQISYLRLLTVSELMKEHVCTNGQAIKAYRELRSDSRIGFLADEPAGVETQWLEYARGSQSSPKRWMDAYLAAVARSAKMSFVTFDRGFLVFPGLQLIILKS